jgi:hypothetical protein
VFRFVTSTGNVYDASYQTNSPTNDIVRSHRTVITNLTQGQSAWVTGMGSQSFGEMYQLASFKGFLYSPPQGLKVVWWAVTTSGGTASSSNVALNSVVINIGNAWSGAQVTIPASAPGIYYIVSGGVSQFDSQIAIDLYLSNKLTSRAFFISNTATSLYRECAHMAPLTSGTTVAIRVTAGFYAPGTGTLGFLLYPQ